MSVASFTYWPDEEMAAASNLKAFMDAEGLADYKTLLERSESDPAWFWNAVIAFLDIRFTKPYSQIMDTSPGIPWTRWCAGGKTNIVLNCLDKHKGTPVWAKPAIDWQGEDGRRRGWSYEELNEKVCRLANGLLSLGAGAGDVVAIYMPMVPEVAAAYLAIAKIGAVSSPLFSGYGESAIRTRLEDAGAKLVITADGMPRAGKTVALKQNLDAALSGATRVEHCIVFSHMGIETPWVEGRDVGWDELLRESEPSLDTAQLDAEAMLTLAYTSGTSGKPKGVVMTHCGFLTKAALDFSIIGDLKASDRFLWMSDFGWVIGTLSIVSSLQAGATLVLADGAPDFPGGRNRLLRIAQDLEVSYLGIAPTLVRAFMMNDVQEISRLDLSAIRIVISSGEPWTPDAWNWCQKHICGSAPLLNISGGTEVSCAILATTVMHPNKPCGFTGPVPGMGARVFDADGAPVSAGEVGELVLTQPSIGMTQGLWRDPDRYIETYWSSYRDVWRHGDWATIDADGIWFIHGRSDDTINIAGKRVGPAEIESLLMESGQIADAAAIAVPDDLKGVAILCVCVPMPGTVANEALAAKLSHYVVAGLGPPFRPREIVFADELPKTRNMKTMRRVVRTAYLGDDPGDLSSLVNPDCVGALERAFGRKGI